VAYSESEMERMKTSHSNAQPPRWAEAILRLTLRPKDRDSVSGDLLEEYRETIVPAIGSAANRWYIRQVASFLLRASWVWGAMLGAVLVIRYLFDALVPPTDYSLRTALLTYAILGVCLLSGLSAAWRGSSTTAGIVISLSAAILGALISIVGTGVMLFIWHDAATLDAWQRSGGLDEAFIDVPLKLVAIGATLGLGGAVIGKGAALATRSWRLS
jgi:hypothetical protein